jgi:thioesterase DpgC
MNDMSEATLTGTFEADAVVCSRRWIEAGRALEALPAKPDRSPGQAAAAAAILGTSQAERERFLARHVGELYDLLTAGRSRFLRVDELLAAAAGRVPGLVPGGRELAMEAERKQADKEGLEADQGIFLAHVLGDATTGRHLCHAMLLPHPATEQHRAALLRDGTLDLPTASLRREGDAMVVVAHNPRFLNAEDATTLDDFEVAVDLATLDPSNAVAVLRGGTVEHPKYAGRHVFSAGINLTHLYYGKIPFLWYMRRDMGVVNKIYRGLAVPDASPDDVAGSTREKPWIAAVDTFAIGGGCQLLLAMDYVLAGNDAYLTLPARKEGIIPGAANLRLARFTGEALARQLISHGRRLECDSPEGRMICDAVTPPDDMDAAIGRAVTDMTASGAVSLVGNRRAFRVGAEPLDTFRSYMAVYAREQAICHFSPQLIGNLERNWNAQQRRP